MFVKRLVSVEACAASTIQQYNVLLAQKMLTIDALFKKMAAPLLTPTITQFFLPYLVWYGALNDEATTLFLYHSKEHSDLYKSSRTCTIVAISQKN